MSDHTPEVTSGYVQVNGTRLYYEIAGEGTPLILVHDALHDMHIWDDQFLSLV